jgi:hypothetical protein
MAPPSCDEAVSRSCAGTARSLHRLLEGVPGELALDSEVQAQALDDPAAQAERVEARRRVVVEGLRVADRLGCRV